MRIAFGFQQKRFVLKSGMHVCLSLRTFFSFVFMKDCHTIRYTNATLSAPCIMENTTYIFPSAFSRSLETLFVVRHNCVLPGLYCDPSSLSCVTAKPINESCTADFECVTVGYILWPRSPICLLVWMSTTQATCNQGFCTQSPDIPNLVTAGQWAIVVSVIFIGKSFFNLRLYWDVQTRNKRLLRQRLPLSLSIAVTGTWGSRNYANITSNKSGMSLSISEVVQSHANRWANGNNTASVVLSSHSTLSQTVAEEVDEYKACIPRCLSWDPVVCKS
jgi:hypothetical protein